MKNRGPISSQQIENLRMAYAIMAGFPAHKIYLGSWRSRKSDMGATDKQLLTECGTTGCIAGVLSAHPFFKAQGFKWNHRVGDIEYKRTMVNSTDISQELFGDSHVFMAGPSGIEGKQHALARIREILHAYGAIPDARYKELAAQEQRISN